MSETSSSDFTTIRRGSRVRHSADGVEGKITWCNGVSVKIEWADGEKVTWKRAELAEKGLELLDEDEAALAANATPAEPIAHEPAPRPAPEPFGPLNLGVPGAGGITETPLPVESAASPADSPVRIQTTSVEGGWVAEVFESGTGTVVFTSVTHPEEAAALAEARDWRPAEGAAEAVEPAANTPAKATATDPATEPKAEHEAGEAPPPVPAKKRTKRSAAKPKPAKTEQFSAIDAAACVLQEAGRAMNCQELIGVMAAKGYWTSPGGKTPAATLYSAILRELQVKGDEARFVKAAKGQFAIRTRS